MDCVVALVVAMRDRWRVAKVNDVGTTPTRNFNQSAVNWAAPNIADRALKRVAPSLHPLHFPRATRIGARQDRLCRLPLDPNNTSAETLGREQYKRTCDARSPA